MYSSKGIYLGENMSLPIKKCMLSLEEETDLLLKGEKADDYVAVEVTCLNLQIVPQGLAFTMPNKAQIQAVGCIATTGITIDHNYLNRKQVLIPNHNPIQDVLGAEPRIRYVLKKEALSSEFNNYFNSLKDVDLDSDEE